MGNLINEALSMGWVVLALLAGLLIYFQFSISDPAAKKRATFKTFIGIIAAILMFSRDDYRHDLRHGHIFYESRRAAEDRRVHVLRGRLPLGLRKLVAAG